VTFVSTDPQNHQGDNTWFTPKQFIDVLGPFELDPCTVSYRPFDTAIFHIEHDLGENGLTFNWLNFCVWLNPPYGKELAPFVDKFIEHKEGCMLIFARMGNEQVQKLVKSGSFMFMLRKRVKFISRYGVQDTNAGTDSMLVFYNPSYIEKCKQLEGVLVRSYENTST
jgi:hypothetical protein